MTPQGISDYLWDVFISYSHCDQEWVQGWLIPRLESAGLKVCIDYRDFSIGAASLINIEKAVQGSRKTLCVLTPDWVGSGWTTFESLLVQTGDPANAHHHVLPLLLKTCEIPPRLGIFTYADFTRPNLWERELVKLLDALNDRTVLPTIESQSPFFSQGKQNFSIDQPRFISKVLGEYSEIASWFIPLRLRLFQSIQDYDKKGEEVVNLDMFPQDLLNDSKRILILGDAGSGKTTLLRWLTQALAKKHELATDASVPLPLYVQVSNFSRSGGHTPLEKLLYMIGQAMFEYQGIDDIVEPNLVLQLLNTSFVLLLDGVNELSPGEVIQFSEAINLLIKKYPQSRCMIASRRNLYAQLRQVDISSVVEIKELSFEEAQELIKRSPIIRDSSDRPSFDDLPARLRHLGQTPLYLRFILELYENGPTVADSPSALISGVMRKRLGWEGLPFVDNQVDNHMSPHSFIEWQALSALAKVLNEQSGTCQYIALDQQTPSALSVVTGIVGDRKQSDSLITRWYERQILQLSGNTLQFWHPVFQVYVLAEELATRIRRAFGSLNEIKRKAWIKSLVQDKTFHDAFVMSVAMIPMEFAEQIVRHLIDEDTVLTARCLDNLPNLKKLRAQFLQDLYHAFLITRIDWIGIPIRIFTYLLLLLAYRSDFVLPNDVTKVFQNVSLRDFLIFMIVFALVVESAHFLYEGWANANFTTPIADAIGHLHFPDAVEILAQMDRNSRQWFVIEGVNYAISVGVVASIESLDKMREALANPSIRSAAIEDLERRRSEESVDLLLEYVEGVSQWSEMEPALQSLLRLHAQGYYPEKILNALEKSYLEYHRQMGFNLKVKLLSIVYKKRISVWLLGNNSS